MKIVDIKLHVLEQETPGYITSFYGLFKQERQPSFKYSLVRVLTDEGIEGHYIVWSEIPDARPDSLAEVLRAYKPYLIGRDPLDRERIWQDLSGLWYGRRGPALAAIDVALWDIAGKATDLPVYKLLGAFRDRIRAYASGNVPQKTEDITRIAIELVERGYTALKLHPIPIESCKALRDAVGDEVDLMYDAVFSFSREKALKVGRQLEKLDFYWYEAPLPANDIEGYIELSRKLDIPVTVELLHQTDYLEFIRRGAVDYLRTMCGFTGGITEMRKVASLCEIYGMNWEPHSYGGTFYQAAHLHAILAVKNCTFFELPIENGREGCFDVGVKTFIRIDNEGHVRPPDKPGLGIEIDWEQIKKSKEIPI